MRDIPVSQARNRLFRILGDVERGETMRIMRHGRPVARIVPEPGLRRSEVEDALANINAHRRRLGEAALDELLAWRDAGRRN